MMAIDPNWVRENPEEAARQMDVLGEMHVDRVRYLWESRGFGGCVEFAEAFDALVQQKKLLSDTCNMAADLADDIEQLTRERDQYRDAEEEQLALRVKAVEREQALAAHVERISDCRLESGRIGIWSLNNALKETPATSLARRDLIKQAEALEELYASITNVRITIYAYELYDRAVELRGQAEALK